VNVGRGRDFDNEPKITKKYDESCEFFDHKFDHTAFYQQNKTPKHQKRNNHC